MNRLMRKLLSPLRHIHVDVRYLHICRRREAGNFNSFCVPANQPMRMIPTIEEAAESQLEMRPPSGHHLLVRTKTSRRLSFFSLLHAHTSPFFENIASLNNIQHQAALCTCSDMGAPTL